MHQGLGAETLISAILAAPEADPTALELSDTDRRLLSQCLLREEEELTPELLEAAIGSLRRRTLERRQRQIRAEIVEAERRNDSASLSHLLREKLEVDRASEPIALLLSLRPLLSRRIPILVSHGISATFRRKSAQIYSLKPKPNTCQNHLNRLRRTSSAKKQV